MKDPSSKADLSPPVDIIHGIGIHVVWKKLSTQHKQALAGFWLKSGAIQDPREAARRTSEVLCVAIDSSGKIAGVSTVYLAPFGQSKLLYWHYRTFIRKDCRVPGLAVRLLRSSLTYLNQVAATPDNLSNGLVILTENRRLKHPGWHRILAREGMGYLGLTTSGMDVWKYDFASHNSLA